ncbi:MAG: oligosaccharide flippase family protein [Bacteroidales bacterium]|nr:oligosaccharide flippase family protein [Bacteroidales bacterium]
MDSISVKSILKNYRKVWENGIFLCLLPIINSAFGLLVYPYLIRQLGAEAYGWTAYVWFIINLILGLVCTPFTLPSAQRIAKAVDKTTARSRVVSSVLQIELLLCLPIAVVYALLVVFLPLWNSHWILFALGFVSIIGNLLTPAWYFQGMQKVKIVTICQLSCRLLSLPFLFVLVRNAGDLLLYMVIMTATNCIIGLCVFLYLRIHDGIRIKFHKIKFLVPFLKEVRPYASKVLLMTLREQSVGLIIGSFIGMRETSLYDLANKLVNILQYVANSVNYAIFPEAVRRTEKTFLKKLMRVEVAIALIMLLGFSAVLYPAVWILGGEEMIGAVPLAFVLMFGILASLLSDGYQQCVLLPNGRSVELFWAELCAFVVYFAIVAISFPIFQNIYILVAAFSLALLTSCIYARYKVKVYNLL